MTSPLVSIIILNWNNGSILPRCLDAVTLQTFKDHEIIVIDNGSTDGSVDELEAQWPGIRVIRLARNIGFAAGNNLGARQARGQWLVLLNTDAFPKSDWLERLIAGTEKYREIDFFASRLIQSENTRLLDGTGDVLHVSGIAWKRQHNHPVNQAIAEVDEVFSPTGAAALYRHDAFMAAGGFDEDFFSYHEDVDLGFRLRLLGYRCLYLPDAVVHHIGSATMGKLSNFGVYHAQRNIVWSYFQNMPPALFWKYLPAHLAANLIYTGHMIQRGRGRAVLRAKRDALRGLPGAVRKRQCIQKNRKVRASELERVLDQGWLTPYTRGIETRRLQAKMKTI